MRRRPPLHNRHVSEEWGEALDTERRGPWSPSGRARALRLLSAAHLEAGPAGWDVLQSAAHALARELGGGCTIHTWASALAQGRVAVGHANPVIAAALGTFVRHVPGGGHDAFSSKLRQSRELIVLPNVTPSMLGLWVEPAFLRCETWREMTSLVVAPLTTELAVTGALTVWREGCARAFCSLELDVIESAAGFVAYAVQVGEKHPGSSRVIRRESSCTRQARRARTSPAGHA